MSVIEKAVRSAREDIEDAFGDEARGLLERLDALGVAVVPTVMLRRQWSDEDAARVEDVRLRLPMNWQVYDDVAVTVGDEERRYKATLLAAGALREAALLQAVNGDRVSLIMDEAEGLILHAEVTGR